MRKGLIDFFAGMPPRPSSHGQFPELSAFYILKKCQAERERRPLEGLAAAIPTLPEWPEIARGCAAIRFPEEAA